MDNRTSDAVQQESRSGIGCSFVAFETLKCLISDDLHVTGSSKPWIDLRVPADDCHLDGEA